jgi:hypothetical protein
LAAGERRLRTQEAQKRDLKNLAESEASVAVREGIVSCRWGHAKALEGMGISCMAAIVWLAVVRLPWGLKSSSEGQGWYFEEPKRGCGKRSDGLLRSAAIAQAGA